MIDETIVGQARVRGILRRMLQGSALPPAFLLFGGEGTGKAATAVELARAAHCDQPSDGACGACPSCRKTSSLQHPDFAVLLPTPPRTSDDKARQLAMEAVRDPYGPPLPEGTSAIRVDVVRDLVRSFARATFEGKRRTAVILHAHRMLPASANALLKTLEEPPPGTMIVLTAPAPEAVLPTVRSRCQRLKLPPVAERDVRNLLVLRGFSEGSAREAAEGAAGNVRLAVALAAEGGGIQARSLQFLETLAASTPLAAFEHFEDLSGDRSEALLVFKGSQLWLRHVLRYLAAGEASLPHGERGDQVRSLARSFDVSRIARTAEAMEMIRERSARNVNLQLGLLDLWRRSKGFPG